MLRNNVTTEVRGDLVGAALRRGCTRRTDWALPGWYHVDAAALAGEPSDLHFELADPEPEVVTETVPPEHGDSRSEKTGTADEATSPQLPGIETATTRSRAV